MGDGKHPEITSAAGQEPLQSDPDKEEMSVDDTLVNIGEKIGGNSHAE